MIEYQPYTSGHCDATCQICGWTQTCDSLALAYQAGHQHRKRGCQ